jgi:hypothetical protein
MIASSRRGAAGEEATMGTSTPRCGGRVAAAALLLTVLAMGTAACGADTGDTRQDAAPSAVSTAPAGPTTVTTAVPAPAGTSPTEAATGSSALPVYVVGATQRGPQLYREFRRGPAAGLERVRAALGGMAPQPDDQDYSTLWPGVRITDLGRNGDELAVVVSGPPSEPETMAVQQLVYTATAADPSLRRVRISGPGLPASAYRVPFVRAPQAEVLAPVWIISPVDGATVGRRVTLRGDASVFEATVSIEVMRGGTMVRSTFATASTGAPGRGTWSSVVTLPAGQYELNAFESSAQDGSVQNLDTKRITVH